ncbi:MULTISPECIES: hypothetical protein [unclassified Ruegeria]|uniref:hypothetical protein n=1 Tax=unclassified Ruegeria TaxID=2625375 RepID=UPI001488DF66|nr:MULTISPECIES: hypothetical protein [unclassified Ruegeria]
MCITKTARDPAWFAADRNFFERHPDREFRFRRARKDELPEGIQPLPDGYLWGVVVQCLGRGLDGGQIRTRHFNQYPEILIRYAHTFDDFHLDMVPGGGAILMSDQVKATMQ